MEWDMGRGAKGVGPVEVRAKAQSTLTQLLPSTETEGFTHDMETVSSVNIGVGITPIKKRTPSSTCLFFPTSTSFVYRTEQLPTTT